MRPKLTPEEYASGLRVHQSTADADTDYGRRTAAIARLAMEPISFGAIAKRVGLSNHERARQIIYKWRMSTESRCIFPPFADQTPLRMIYCTARAHQALLNLSDIGIVTVGDFRAADAADHHRLHYRDLLTQPNIGRRTVNEIFEIMNAE